MGNTETSTNVPVQKQQEQIFWKCLLCDIQNNPLTSKSCLQCSAERYYICNCFNRNSCNNYHGETWTCSCCIKNYSFVSICRKCGFNISPPPPLAQVPSVQVPSSPPLSQLQPSVISGSTSNIVQRSGDWYCSCGEMNFASRDNCRKCRLGKNAFVQRSGDWNCSCGEMNFASRNQCRKCGLGKITFSNASGSNIVQKIGDWTCSCGELNFASRDQCRKCGVDKNIITTQLYSSNETNTPFSNANVQIPDTADSYVNNSTPILDTVDSYVNNSTQIPDTVDSYVNNSTQIHDPPIDTTPITSTGDWNCSCGELNFASRSQCRKCGIQKNITPLSTNQNPPPITSHKPGDWICSCGELNFASRSQCRKCKVQKN